MSTRSTWIPRWTPHDLEPAERVRRVRGASGASGAPRARRRHDAAAGRDGGRAGRVPHRLPTVGGTGRPPRLPGVPVPERGDPASMGRPLATRHRPHAALRFSQLAARLRGRVVVGGYSHSRCDIYSSDRPFVQLLAGVPLVDHRVPKVDALLADGRDWVLTTDETSAIDAIDRLLDGRLDVEGIGHSGVRAVEERHTTSHRVAVMAQVFDELLGAQRSGRRAVCPALPFFAPGVPAHVRAVAQRGW